MTHKLFRLRFAIMAAALFFVPPVYSANSVCKANAAENSVNVTTEDDAIALKIQGEYLSTSEDESEPKIGIQVIALGDGKYQLVGYSGGLPGEAGVELLQKAEGTLEGDSVKFDTDHGKGELKDGQIKILADGGAIVAEFERVERTSPTMGAKPPEGAIVLFDGSTAENFENGKLVDGGLAATGCFSKMKFGDHKIHLEFRTPFMPKARGQGRGNSGVYVQSRYEVQVLDSFGLAGESNECGGIYRVSKPRVNMCYPPMAWQTYDIDFKAAKWDEEGNKISSARITVVHNGVMIHEDLEVPNSTPGRFGEKEGPESLFLQDHGNPVVFRNIWVVAEESAE